MITEDEIDGDTQSERYDSLADAIRAAGDIATVRMWVIRNIHGADRLGVNVITNIKHRLNSLGINFSPEEMPNNQNATVLLFRRGSKIDQIASHFRSPQENSDVELSDLVSDDEILKTISRIRELVCD